MMRNGKSDTTAQACQRVWRVIEQRQRFVLTTHVYPDGDGLGAEAAMAEALLQLGKRVDVINSDPTPPHCQFIAGTEAFQVYQPRRHDHVLAQADVIMLLDAANPGRTGRLAPALAKYSTGETVMIDHHADSGWARVELHRPDACSACEAMVDLLRYMPVRITPSMAEALYTGIVFDTQGFRIPDTSPRIHRIAAELLEAGASVERVQQSLFASWPVGRLRLLAHFLSGLHTAAKGRLVWGAITLDDLRRWRQTPAALEGFASQALTVAGAELAVLFHETEPNTVRLSFRSRGGVTVEQLARSFGGGGLPCAAGARTTGRLSTVQRKVLRQAVETLHNGVAGAHGGQDAVSSATLPAKSTNSRPSLRDLAALRNRTRAV
ncbi:MAG: DHH family phosphoesterase [Chloroflexi bacterium]|nr:DHH family phosphoesterase [Chloroflexota bacterium]